MSLKKACPIQEWPDAEVGPPVSAPAGLSGGVTDGGPSSAHVTGTPEVVWLTAESLGSEDPALLAHPELPRVFVFDEPLLTLSTYSFPSGHTLGATMFYGVLAAYLVCVVPRWRVRTLVVLGACTMVALVALSRVYLGAHFLSDVLAAMLEGCAWLAVCITSCSTLRRQRAARITE